MDNQTKPIEEIIADLRRSHDYTIAELRELFEIVPEQGWETAVVQKAKQLSAWTDEPICFTTPEGPTFRVDEGLSAQLKRFYAEVILPYWCGEKSIDGTSFALRAERILTESENERLEEEIHALEGGYQSKNTALKKKIASLKRKRK